MISNYFFSDISPKEVQEKEIIVGIVTDIDLLHHVSQKESRSGSSSGGNFANYFYPRTSELKGYYWDRERKWLFLDEC